ncbi:kinase-like domain-containing protein [Mucidula mucida]|nr:kinase-like domain-containing protein [Mucidula mucida]
MPFYGHLTAAIIDCYHSLMATEGPVYNLPESLSDWGVSVPENDIWVGLHSLFQAHGIELWKRGYWVAPHLKYNVGSGGGRELKYKTFSSLHHRVGNNRDGVAVVVHAAVKGEEGRERLRLTRLFGTGGESSVATNHMLPLWGEIIYEDMVFIVSPLVHASFQAVFDTEMEDNRAIGRGNSVGDILDMMLQCIEAIAFLHSHRIAHRDAFIQNYLVQWLPQSLRRGKPSTTKPRVYLIDLEFSIQFSADCPEDQCKVVGPPVDSPHYVVPVPPEGQDGEPYCPFKADVWQLGYYLQQLSSNIEEIDAVIREMVNPDPVARMSCEDLLNKFRDVVYNVPPEQLHVAPTITLLPYY